MVVSHNDVQGFLIQSRILQIIFNNVKYIQTHSELNYLVQTGYHNFLCSNNNKQIMFLLKTIVNFNKILIEVQHIKHIKQ